MHWWREFEMNIHSLKLIRFSAWKIPSAFLPQHNMHYRREKNIMAAHLTIQCVYLLVPRMRSLWAIAGHFLVCSAPGVFIVLFCIDKVVVCWPVCHCYLENVAFQEPGHYLIKTLSWLLTLICHKCFDMKFII